HDSQKKQPRAHCKNHRCEHSQAHSFRLAGRGRRWGTPHPGRAVWVKLPWGLRAVAAQDKNPKTSGNKSRRLILMPATRVKSSTWLAIKSSVNHESLNIS